MRVSIKQRTSCSPVQIKDAFYNSESRKEDVNVQKFCVAAPGREQRPEPIISAFAEIKNIGIFKCRQFIVRTDRLAGITLSPVIMSHSVMISAAHLDSLTQEALCDSLGNRNHSYSADSTTS